MKQIVYVDVLVALNIIISFFLIKSVCAVSQEKPKSYRVLIGSMMGGAYSLVIFLPQVHIALSVVGRIVFLLAVNAVVFGAKGIRRFLRCYLLLCAATVLCAGAFVALWMLFLPQAVTLRNGSFYVDVGFIHLVGVCGLVYIVAKLFGRFLAKRSSEEINVRVKIGFCGKTANTNGIVDTGNTLCDSFTGAPVNIISQSLALNLLPDSHIRAAIEPLSGNLPEGMHLIVFDTVGSSALMCAFRVDKMTVVTTDKQMDIEGATVAVSPQETFTGGKNVLVNAAYINDIQGGRDSDKKTEGTYTSCKTKAEKTKRLLHKRPRNSACTADKCTGKRGDAAH